MFIHAQMYSNICGKFNKYYDSLGLNFKLKLYMRATVQTILYKNDLGVCFGACYVVLNWNAD